MSQKIPILVPECGPFPCHFKKKKSTTRNFGEGMTLKFMKIKFIRKIKNRLRMRTRMASRTPTANISPNLDTRHLLLFYVRSATGHKKLAGKLLFLKACSQN
jgi:hypothetical protein